MEANLKPDQVNTGIAVVTPMKQLQQVLDAYKLHRRNFPIVISIIDVSI
jgi:hypothetical protein